ncbi:MAG: choice-of-anchor J domain-containing protein, partial [Candidatus Cloacimonadales bacterium]
MKKIMLAFMLCVLMITGLFAQQLTDGFETWPSGNWNLIESTTTNTISQSSSQANSGTSSLRFSSYTSASSYDQYIVSNEITWTDPANEFSFYHRSHSEYGDEEIAVGWSTTGNDVNADFTWTATIEPILSWGQYLNTTLPAETKYVAIHYFSDYAYYCYIDDIVLGNVLAGTPDVPTLVSPGNNVVNTDLIVHLNWTTGANTDHAVLYLADNLAWTGATVEDPATSNYSTTSLNSGTTYYWKVVAVSAGGIEATSATYSFTTVFPAITQFPWTEGFEGAEPNWTIIDNNNDGDMWDTNYSSNAYEGSEAATIYTDYNAGANDDYLISPQMTLTGNERLKFWYRVQGSGEPNDFRVVLSTTGVDPADFTNIILPLTECSNTTYQEETIDLSDYSGNCYFAFHVPQGGLDGWRLYIDYVTVEEIPTGTLVQITPSDTYDFGNVLTGTVATQIFTVANSGVESAVISEITVPTGYAFEFSEEELPITLEPNSSFTVTVTFSPINEMMYSGNLRVKETEPGNPFGGQNHDVALTGVGIPVPQGATCANPIPLIFPAENIAGNTVNFYDDYDNAWVTPSTYYLSGDDVVYQFTLANSMLLNGTITTTNSWIGAFILEEEPNEANPAPVILSKTNSSTTLTYTNEMLSAGTYFLIISSYTSPQSITYNINLTADALPAPGMATSPSPTNEAVDQPSIVNLSWNNANYTETIDLWFGIAGARDMA